MRINESKYFIYDRPVNINWKYPIKKLRDYIYKLKLVCSTVRPQEKKYNVSVCAIFKNEAPYLREWLEFNHLVGVEHFFLYNNNSEDDYLSVLKPYIERGWVTLVQWPHNQMQMESYKDCIQKYAELTKWLGFIDIDEFVVPKKTNNIYDFLRNFENRGAVLLYWKLFGSSGIDNRDVQGLVSKDFIVCWPKYCSIGKCFYNTAYDFDFDTKKNSCLHHFLWVKRGSHSLPPVNVFDKVCTAGIQVVENDDFPIQINHYFTKSYKEYAIKRAKGDVYFKINPHDEEYFYKHEMKCTSVDYSAYKYLIKLESELGMLNE